MELDKPRDHGIVTALGRGSSFTLAEGFELGFEVGRGIRVRLVTCDGAVEVVDNLKMVLEGGINVPTLVMGKSRLWHEVVGH